ncbi:unnamed protein product [Choristocarpus tenellus]
MLESLLLAAQLFDCDRDGTLTQSELREILWSLGQHPTEDDMANMLQKHDHNGNGTLDYDEFKTLIISKIMFKNTREEFAVAFRAVNKNKDGALNVAELNRMLAAAGCKLTESELDQIFGSFDKDGNGRIDIEEFLDHMLSN